MTGLHKELFDQNHIDQNQFQYLDLVQNRKIISVYYELRLTLYLGIMLFTGGIGYIVYQNLSDLLHIVLMALLGVSIAAGGYYIHVKSKPYGRQTVVVEHFYFDYIVVLVSLLIISLFTYVQVYFDLVSVMLQWTSFITSGLFLLMAYRYDNKIVLSMGITALAAAFGLTISPVDWYSGGSFNELHIYILSILMGASLLVIGQVFSVKDIKRHFTFTYHNFGLLLFYFGMLTLTFDSSIEAIMALLLLLISGGIGWYSWKNKFFLFFMYSCITSYISFTYLILELGMDEFLMLWYFPISCITAVVLLIKHRSHFSND